MTDRVFVREMTLDTVIGVYDWERKVRQTLVVDLEMAFDISRAAASDDVSHALDYAAVCDRLRAYASASSFQLVEALAENMAAVILAEFDVSWLHLRLCKPGAVPGTRDVGIVIERGRLN